MTCPLAKKDSVTNLFAGVIDLSKNTEPWEILDNFLPIHIKCSMSQKHTAEAPSIS